MKLRLHQFLSKTGAFDSKKHLLAAVEKGEISIEGKQILNPEFQFNWNKRVTWKGRKLILVREHKYYIMNKPAGFTCMRMQDRSIFELVEDDKTLFSVGRLDKDTTGLLIITNDGKLGFALTYPQKGISKTYQAELAGPLQLKGDEEKGVRIKLEHNGKIQPYMTRPFKLEKLNGVLYNITLTEGKKREVKRIFEALGNKVVSLKRIQVGGLKLDDLNLPEGKVKKTTKKFLVDHIFFRT